MSKVAQLLGLLEEKDSIKEFKNDINDLFSSAFESVGTELAKDAIPNPEALGHNLAYAHGPEVLRMAMHGNKDHNKMHQVYKAFIKGFISGLNKIH